MDGLLNKNQSEKGYGGSPQGSYQDTHLNGERIINQYYRESDLNNYINERSSRLNPSENI